MSSKAGPMEETRINEDGINTPDSESALNATHQQVDMHDQGAQIQLPKSRFILVLVGLVLAIFLVRMITDSDE
jgi:MFS transporter, DHA2 family, glioxin efflux transporter